MRKWSKIFLSVILFLTIFLVGGFLLKNNNKSITAIFNKKPYPYLSKEANDYIEKVYEETGDVVHTEKNKEDGEPYLNPKYIEYLELSDEEKEKIELIPDTYILDYSVNKAYGNSELPSAYDLRNDNGNNYVSPIKDQGSTGICWAFASIENAETLLMKQKNQSYSDGFQKFSIRQLDYVTSTDYLIVSSSPYTAWSNPDNGSRKLGEGGNFFTSSIVMANALSLTDESILPWTEKDSSMFPKDIMGYDKSLYEVNSTIVMPTINQNSASEELINSYVNDVKNYMLQYGGPFVGTYSPKSTCGFENIDGTKVIKTDDCVNDSSNLNQNHAMQIIGWDDNYEYSYCDDGTKHYAVKNDSCTSGELTYGKGAWILRNSWGEELEEGNAYKYVYLTYDSTRLSIGFITSVSEMANRNWDNNYHGNPWIDRNISNGMASVSEQTKEFDTHNNKSEKIEKIKFATASKNGKYTLSVITDNSEYNNIAVVNSNEVGIYTVDLSNKKIILEGNTFSVKIVGENDSKFYNDSISIFTSNIDTTPMVITYSGQAYDSTKPLSNLNPLYVRGDNYWRLTVSTYLKNIPTNSDLTYRVQSDDGVIAVEQQIADITKSIINDVGRATFSGSYSSSNSYFSTREAYGKTYTFEILYGDVVVDSFPIKFSGKGEVTKSNVRLYANNGTDYYYDTKVTDKTSSTFKLDNINSKNFYNNGYYITGWNTMSDGTGISYGLDDAITIYHDTILYAQWSSELLNVMFNFKCNYSDYCSGTMNSITLNLNDSITMPENSFIKDGYKFELWTVDNKNHYGLELYEQENRTVLQLIELMQNSYNHGYFVFNNSKIDVTAKWLENSKTITFDSNGGIGNMKSINLAPSIININGKLVTYRIKDNLFIRDGYTFVNWNTLADGSGTSYTSSMPVEDDIMLYAQWSINTGTITFDSNYDDNQTNEQTFTFNEDTKLDKNTFIRDGYSFVNWNTLADGTGTVYTDEQLVSLSDNIVLYAQWITKYDFNVSLTGDTLFKDDITINLNIKKLMNVDLNSIAGTLNYDKTKIELTNYETISGYSLSYDNDSNCFTITGSNFNNNNNNNSILVLTFKNLDLNDWGSTIISINDISINDGNALIENDNLNKKIVYSKSEYIKGDLNKNGQIDLPDIILLLKNYLGLSELNNIDLIIGDMNNNNKIDLPDIILLLKIYLGIN